MNEIADELILFARWVVPVASEPLRDGAVVIEGSRIKLVCSQDEARRHWNQKQLAQRVRDYGNAIIVPGLINLHTHLDSSYLSCIDVDSGMFEWIKALVNGRRHWPADLWWHSAVFGARQAALSGTSLVVDNSYSGLSVRALAHVGLRGVVGLELFGLREDRCEADWSNWLARFDKLRCGLDPQSRQALDAETIKLTVSPHAPYTVCPGLWQKASAWARQAKLPVLAHVAESRQECEWIGAGNAEIDAYHDFLRNSVAADKLSNEKLPWQACHKTPVELLEAHGLLHSSLVAAHAVHLSERDIELLARHGCKIAHCPRSNARLRNGRGAVERWRQSGITFGLGTDSLASCDDLDMRNEALFALNLHRACIPEIAFDDQACLAALTIDSARAIGLENETGSLEAGKFADIAVFAPDRAPFAASNNPLVLLFHGMSSLVDLIVNGRLVVEGGSLPAP